MDKKTNEAVNWLVAAPISSRIALHSLVYTSTTGKFYARLTVLLIVFPTSFQKSALSVVRHLIQKILYFHIKLNFYICFV